ncbi:MAG: DUF983 domain-containing protein [Chloroflexi bacterium]|nr:DUF983 domain-containing protein [Chloroflexota bacterium]
MKTMPQSNKPNWLNAILLRKCPKCRQGNVFRGTLQMYEDCPHCGTHFEREDGYFMMSVFVGYVMSFFVTIPTIAILYFTLRPSVWGYLIGAAVALLVTAPLIFHYARVIWMFIDQLLDPRPETNQ